MWGQDGWRSHRLVSYRARYLRFRYIYIFIYFLKLSSALRGLSHRRGNALRSFVTLDINKIINDIQSWQERRAAEYITHAGWAPFVLPQPGITGRYLQQECGAAASVLVQAYHIPSSVRQQRFNRFHTRFYHTLKHTLWVFGRAITPPFYHPPSFITPPNTPCGCSDVLSHPLVYHAPLGSLASCTLSPGGIHKISPPPQDTTPGNSIFKSQNVTTGVCYLVSVTVRG